MFSLRNFRAINPEWFRSPLSKIEETLRMPYLIKNGVVMIALRVFLPWLGLTAVIYWLTGRIQLAALGPIVILIYELFSLKDWFETRIINKHLENVKKVKQNYHQSKKANKTELVGLIEKSVRLTSWGMIRIVYVGLAAWGWVIIFRTMLPLITKSKHDYQDMLIGFNNKTYEADQALWEVANGKKKLSWFLEKYGSRVEDIDLELPTLQENKQTVNAIIKLYKSIPSPTKALENAKLRRIKKTKEVMEDLRVSKTWFKWFLRITQENGRLREDRRYYIFLADYYVRQMIIRLGQELNLSKDEVFNKSWKELRYASN